MSLPVWAEFIAGSFGGERGFSAIFLPRGWGEAKSIPLLLQIIDRLDRYSDPLEDFSSPELSIERRHKPSARRGKTRGNENRRRRPRPIRRGAARIAIAKRATT